MGAVSLFDRVVLTLYTFFLTVFSILVILTSLGWGYPLALLNANLETTPGRWGTGIVSAVLLTASLRLLYLGFRKRKGSQTVVHETPMGEVRVSLDAIEDLIRRVGRQVQGVRESRARVTCSPSGLKVVVKLGVSPDVSIPQVSDELQTTIKDYVKNVVGVDVSETQVLVETISTESKRSRVE